MFEFKIERIRRNIKQYEVAELIGVSIPTIRKYERENTNLAQVLNMSQFKALADLFNIDVETLYNYYND